MAHLRNGALLEGNGICTYYNYGGIGACGTPIAKGVAICAMGKGDDSDWKSHCGATIELSNDKGSGTCKVRDECPECEQGHLDTAAFLHVCTVEEGVCSVTWRIQGSNEKHVASISAPVPANSESGSFPFHDGSTAEAASSYRMAETSNASMSELLRWNLRSADTAMTNPADNGLVYNNMGLLREWAYSWCGAGNVDSDAWSTGKSSAGDNSGALACDNGASSHYSCRYRRRHCAEEIRRSVRRSHVRR
jgi:hypothetical protein